MHRIDMAHTFGTIAKWVIIIIVFGFSITLSVMFFQNIAPPDKPWFTPAGLGLTEGGFILWMITFMLTRHQPVQKAIALIMACACGFSSLTVAGYEFYELMSEHYSIAQNTQIIQWVSILLEIIFASHLVALVIDLLAGYFSAPGHTFRINSSGINVIEEDRTFSSTGTIKAIPQHSSSKMSFADAAVHILDKHNQPMHYKEIAQEALGSGLLSTRSVRPDATMNSQISSEMKSAGSRFVRAGVGKYSLSKWNKP